MLRWRPISRWIAGLLACVYGLVCSPLSVSGAAARSAADFNLLDLRGKNHSLRRAEGKVVVLFFTGNGCPVARKTLPKVKSLHERWESQGVQFWVINTFAEDSLAECRKEYNEFDAHPLLYLRDPKQAVAFSLGVQRTAEVVAVQASDGLIIYQGAMDDQLAEGAERVEPTQKFLEKALADFLAGQQIEKSRTASRGCRINYAINSSADNSRAYTDLVAPILKKNCVSCHQEGGIGPFAMDGHGRVKNYARMIEEVLLTGQMPPWHADPEFGKWTNDRAISAQDTLTLLKWVEAGAPRGEGEDPLKAQHETSPAWALGKPSLVLSLPKPEEIPATGVLDYRHIKIPLATTNDLWISAADVKPGNRKVVHHVIVRAQWPGGPDDGSGHGVNIVGWAPGMNLETFPEGTGKLISKGATIDVEMHYTTIGSPQTDQTEIALYLHPTKPARKLVTRAAINEQIEIPPGVDESRDSAIYGFKRPATIYTLMPHMHLRGKWMRFELLRADGSRETLLNVPRYDFNWQTVYRFAEPLRVPAGSWLAVTGAFDNSAGNPSNPDPKKRVHFGLQSWDEMFIGFFDAVDEPMATSARVEPRRVQ